MRHRTIPLGFLLLLLTAPGLRQTLAEGIDTVGATADFIRIKGVAPGGILRFVELQPWQTVTPSNFTATLATVTNVSAIDLRIPRFNGTRDRNFATNSTATVATITNVSAFEFRVPRFDGARDRLFSSFLAMSETPAGTLTAVGTNRFVEEMGDIPLHDVPFPEATSKKGLQVQMVDDALALGVKHAAFNVNFSQLIDLDGASNSLPWSIDGRIVHFHRRAIEHLDRQVRPLSDAGAVIALILLAYESSDPRLNRILLDPRYSKSAPNHLGAFNTSSAEGVLHFRACVEFLADHYARPGPTRARVANFILGNEVNSHWFWANMGPVSMEEFTAAYLSAARLAATALRRVSSTARLYLSLEHHWNIRYPGGNAQQAFAGRAFLDEFNRRARAQGDFEWHLAFHPYPENLFEPRTWNDRSATSDVLTTPRITFKNIELLPRYLRQPGMLHRGQVRRVILSEQGFHTPDGPDGELGQAAAYAYAWRKIVNLDGIDAFILHRHVDHPHEGGLNLGLWRRRTSDPNSAAPAAKKRIYDVFRLADTPGWEKAFEFALPVIGIQGWEEGTKTAGEGERRPQVGR